MRRLIILSIISLFSLQAGAKVTVTLSDGRLGDISYSVAAMGQQEGAMHIELNFGFSLLSLESSQAVLLTPVLISDSLRVELPSVGVYGKKCYKNASLGDIILLASDCGDGLSYSRSVVWEDWMKNCDLLLVRKTFDARGQKLSEGSAVMATSEEKVFSPEFKMVRPASEGEKRRVVSGSAYITYPNGQKIVIPGYGDNSSKLAKIETALKAVIGDPDITVNSIVLRGHSSPQGTYDSNLETVSARTEALRDYIEENYGVREGVISTECDPEDWEGVREYVDGSILVFRTEILDVIDNDPSEPDRKEWIIKSRYPRDYQRLVRDCYPSLRRADYRIDYTIMSYSDVEEMRHLASSAPEKLSHEEFYLAAQGLEPGGAAQREIFEAAVQVYPDDPIANLNAANAAMSGGDLDKAALFLAKAGESPEASYAREVHAALSGDSLALERLEKNL